jgi:hypothetical protein
MKGMRTPAKREFADRDRHCLSDCRSTHARLYLSTHTFSCIWEI